MNKKLLVIGLAFFFLWKNILTLVLWQDRYTPPVTDDALVYISNIESVRICPTLIFCKDNLYNLSGPQAFDRLMYRIPFGVIAKLLQISSENIFFLSFFIGNIFILISSYLFVSSLKVSPQLKYMLIITLAFFHGNGLYHGFYWLVPSAFALGYFLITFSILLRPKILHLIYLFLIIPIGIFTHLIYLYFLIIPFLYSLVFSILSKKIFRKQIIYSIMTIIYGLMCYLPVEYYLQKKSNGYSYGIVNSYKSISSPNTPISENKKASLKIGTNNLPGFEQIYLYYFRLVFGQIYTSIPFILLLIVLWIEKKYQILSIYVSVLIFTALSTFSAYGYRSLIITWPVTLIVVGMGVWQLILQSLWNKFIAFILLTLFLGFLSYLAAQALFLSVILNQDHTWDVDDRAKNYIINKISSQTPVYYGGKIPESYIGANSLYFHLNRTLDQSQACINIIGIPNNKTHYSFMDNLLFKIKGIKPSIDYIYVPKQFDAFVHQISFGSLHIYSNPKCQN